MRKPLEVTITIDTEFSIGGAFNDPSKRPVAEPIALCEIDGKGHGVDFLLDTFNQYDIKATFFVECLNYYYFGDQPMKSIVEKIQSAGQDPQLHIHPSWLKYYKDDDFTTWETNDSCAGRDYQELKKIFEYSIEIFERWVGKRPDAIRTGNLEADLNTYKVMSELKIPIASNIGLGVWKPDDGELWLESGRTKIFDVMEVPIFTYQDKDLMGQVPAKSLQITSCSWPEMKYLLLKARKKGIENIVILTHPFEFIKKKDIHYSQIIRNRVNQERLEKLCSFIKEHDQDFTSADFGSNVKEWGSKPLKNTPYFKVPPRFRLGRKLHNFVNDMIWTY